MLRRRYQRHGRLIKKVFTADMQKPICMLKLPTEDYYFSRKLVLFNETFVSPGKNEPVFCVVCGTKLKADEKLTMSPHPMSIFLLPLQKTLKK